MSDWANKEQREYMDYLASIPAHERCWCGWFRLGRCSGAQECNTHHSGKTAADKIAAREAEKRHA